MENEFMRISVRIGILLVIRFRLFIMLDGL